MVNFAPQRILCPVDLDDSSVAVVRWAGLFARTFAAELEVLYADWWEPPRYFTEAQIGSLTKQARRDRQAALALLTRVAEEALGPDLPRSLEVLDGHPASVILERARASRIGMIVMGSRGRTGLARLRLGSVAEDVVQQSASPTLIVKNQQPPSVRQVLCPVNFTEASRKCLELASTVAAAFRAPLTVVHALESREAGQTQLDTVRQQLCSWVPPKARAQCDLAEVVRRGDAAEQVVLLAAENRADLIVLGADSHSFLEYTTLGTTTERVIRHSRVSVLLVPHHTDTAGNG